MHKTWYSHVSNPILIHGNTYVSKTPYISLRIVVFWGVFTLGSATPHVLSCFICSFSSISISSSRNISWCAVISLVHTFYVLLWQAEELLSWGGPMVDAQSHQEVSPGVQSLLPACQHLGDCLWYPCVYQAVLRLGFGREVPQHLHREVAQDTCLWFGCERCPRNLCLCPWEPLPVPGSCHSVCTTLSQPLAGCTGLDSFSSTGIETSSDVLILPAWIFCHCISCLAPFSHLLKASLVRKGVKMGQDDLSSHRSFNVCMPWAFAAWLPEINIKGYKWPPKQCTLTAPYLQKEWITYRVEFWGWVNVSLLSYSFVCFIFSALCLFSYPLSPGYCHKYYCAHSVYLSASSPSAHSLPTFTKTPAPS